MELFESDSRVVSKALVGHKDQVTCSKFAGENVLSASLDRTVRIWKSVLEEEDSEVVCTHPEGVLSMSKTSKDEKIISGSKHGDIYLQDLESRVFLSESFIGSGAVAEKATTSERPEDSSEREWPNTLQRCGEMTPVLKLRLIRRDLATHSNSTRPKFSQAVTTA
ncbi:hypothetical protein SprV_0301221100 [Sparganum proliferum]